LSYFSPKCTTPRSGMFSSSIELRPKMSSQNAWVSPKKS
jgi:hypothetical protein